MRSTLEGVRSMEGLGRNDGRTAHRKLRLRDCPDDGLGDLRPARSGWFNGVRVVFLFRANESEIDDLEPVLCGNANDDVIEESQRDYDSPLIARVRKVAVIDRADHERQIEAEACLHSHSIGRFELADHFGQEYERLTARFDRRVQDFCPEEGVVPSDAQQQV